VPCRDLEPRPTAVALSGQPPGRRHWKIQSSKGRPWRRRRTCAVPPSAHQSRPVLTFPVFRPLIQARSRKFRRRSAPPPALPLRFSGNWSLCQPSQTLNIFSRVKLSQHKDFCRVLSPLVVAEISFFLYLFIQLHCTLLSVPISCFYLQSAEL